MDNDTNNDTKRHDKSSLFVRSIKRAYTDYELTIYDLAVLDAISYHANNITNKCFPSRSTIAKLARMKDVQTVDKCIKKLIERGYLRKESGEAKGTSNIYTVIYDDNEALNLVRKAPANDNIIDLKAKKEERKIPEIAKKFLKGNEKSKEKAPAEKQEPVVSDLVIDKSIAIDNIRALWEKKQETNSKLMDLYDDRIIERLLEIHDYNYLMELIEILSSEDVTKSLVTTTKRKIGIEILEEANILAKIKALTMSVNTVKATS